MNRKKMEKCAEETVSCIERDSARNLTQQQREVIRAWLVRSMITAHSAAIDDSMTKAELARRGIENLRVQD